MLCDVLASTTLTVVNFCFSTAAVMRVFKSPTAVIGLVLPEPVSFADYEGYLISAISIFSVLLVYNDKQAGVYGTADAHCKVDFLIN